MTSVTQAEFARICGVNRSTVNRWITNGRIVTDKQGLIDPDAAAKMRDATESQMPHHQARKAQFDEVRASAMAEPEKTGHSAPTQASDTMPAMGKIETALKLESYKLQKAKAEQANLELDKKSGALADVEKVHFALNDFVSAARVLIEDMPDRYAASVAAAAYQGETEGVRSELSRISHDLLTEIHDTLIRVQKEINE